MANDNGSKDPRVLMKEATVAAETARQRLQHAQHELSRVGEALVPLSRVSALLEPVAERLSDMMLDAARRMGPGEAGEPFVVLIDELNEIARQVAIALCDLETYVRRSARYLHKAISEAQQSSAELERIIPPLRAANSTPPPLPDVSPPGEKVVALQLKVNPGGEKGAAARNPPSILDLWPAAPDGRHDLKN